MAVSQMDVTRCKAVGIFLLSALRSTAYIPMKTEIHIFTVVKQSQPNMALMILCENTIFFNFAPQNVRVWKGPLGIT